MAEFQMLVQEDEELEVIAVSGDLHIGEMLRFAETSHQKKRQPYVIWDLRETSLHRIPAAQLFMQFDIARRYSKPGYKTALVLGSDADFGLGRLIENYTEAQGNCEQFRAFRDRESAEIWLKSSRLGASVHSLFPALHK